MLSCAKNGCDNWSQMFQDVFVVVAAWMKRHDRRHILCKHLIDAGVTIYWRKRVSVLVICLLHLCTANFHYLSFSLTLVIVRYTDNNLTQNSVVLFLLFAKAGIFDCKCYYTNTT